MNKKALIIITFSLLAITSVCGVVIAVSKNHSNASEIDVSTHDPDSDYTYISPSLEDEDIASEIEKDNNDIDKEIPDSLIDDEVLNFVPATEMDLDPTSITVYVNKEYSVSKNFKPEKLITPNIRFDFLDYSERTLMHPEAAKALEELFSDAEEDDCDLVAISAYRSYSRQYKIFTNNLVYKGKRHTLLYSAVPGTSEHQTGLAIDVSTEALNNKLVEAFSDTPEGKWLAKNSYKYGYVVRYPKDKAEITGYAYEPWHIRYVGKGLANYLYTNKLTLDEYYNYTPSPDFNFEKEYANILNYQPPTPTPTVEPTISIPLTPSLTPSLTPTMGIDDGTGTGTGNNIKPTKTPKPEDPKDNISPTPMPTPQPTPQPTPIPKPSPSITDTPEESDGIEEDDSLDTSNFFY